MTQNAWPYTGDSIQEPQWRAMARLWRRTGVVDDVAGELTVSAVAGALQVSVAAGEAWLDGYYYANDSAVTLTLATADLNNDRIDLIVVRSTAGDSAELAVITGAPTAEPIAPSPTQDHDGTGVFELVLAEVLVATASGNVDDQVTDRRTFSLTPQSEIVAGLRSDVDAARSEGLAINAEQNVRLWQLEADVLGAAEGFPAWQGEAFLNGMDNVASLTGDIAVSRAATLDGGALTLSVSEMPALLAAVAAGDWGTPLFGGFLVGVIDTTQGNIIGADASQVGERYALIVSPKDLEQSLAWKDAQTAGPAATHTRWNGLTATVAMASAAYPAANYCMGLADPGDEGSRWYLPAMDELELIYRNLKSTAEDNYTGNRAGGDFPGGTINYGENVSSDPAGAPYTAASPAQTSVDAFRDGGGQDLGDAGTNRYYWTATEYSASDAWLQNASGSNAGIQSNSGKTGASSVRPVRRVVL